MTTAPISAPAPARRRSRLGLYGPFAALLLLAVMWSIAWFVIRARTADGIDGWIGREAAAGRRWTCQDRAIAGFPFRIEVTCANLSLERTDVTAAFGRVTIVSQVYRPAHVIAEAAGPLRLAAGGTVVDGEWARLRASVITNAAGLDRAAFQVDAPKVNLSLPNGDRLALASRELESHLRPSPTRPEAWDFSLAARGAAIPNLDALIGGTEPADLEAVLDITQAAVLPARPLAQEFERWRVAGGQVHLNRLTLAKGPRRAEASGLLELDAEHRPSGRIEAAAAGLGGVVGPLLNSPAAGLVGALLGAGRAAPAPREPGAPALRPLPPLVLAEGRVLLGPFPLPGIRLPRLD